MPAGFSSICCNVSDAGCARSGDQDLDAAVIGAGPAGLMASEALLERGFSVELYDSMPTPARKFLLAGKGGLNLTHSEPFENFLERYGPGRARLEPHLRAFGPSQLRDWAAQLGISTFVGSSGRVFPREMKAAPLLRAWLRRLREQGVKLHSRHRWVGWTAGGELLVRTPEGEITVAAPAVVLALGGASWSRLGSDGAWVPWLRQRGLAVATLRPSNCGFEVEWSEKFRQRYAGHPVKSVTLSHAEVVRRGELMVTEYGLEGSLIYPYSPALRDEIEARGEATVQLDLAPDRTLERLQRELALPRGSRSLSEHLRRRAHIEGVKAGLLRELVSASLEEDLSRLGACIKALPLRLRATRPLEEAISSAGGLVFDELGPDLMLRRLPGVFAAGEMLDWEAPTGGYLLTACLATGRAAGVGAANWLSRARAAAPERADNKSGGQPAGGRS
ncbi:TIGR03862 family flavoprotein [bacterium CPR1]|nr:TIGR03862 family flavoprotein [bacterium CPR1]